MRNIKILLWASLIVSVLVYSLWGPIKLHYGIKIFYKGDAFVHLIDKLLLLLLCLQIPSNGIKKLAVTLLGFAVSNLMDELFFDPTKIELNEYIAAIIICILASGLFNQKTEGKGE
jgi:hypothetical protein